MGLKDIYKGFCSGFYKSTFRVLSGFRFRNLHVRSCVSCVVLIAQFRVEGQARAVGPSSFLYTWRASSGEAEKSLQKTRKKQHGEGEPALFLVFLSL